MDVNAFLQPKYIIDQYCVRLACLIHRFYPIQPRDVIENCIVYIFDTSSIYKKKYYGCIPYNTVWLCRAYINFPMLSLSICMTLSYISRSVLYKTLQPRQFDIGSYSLSWLEEIVSGQQCRSFLYIFHDFSSLLYCALQQRFGDPANL